MFAKALSLNCYTPRAIGDVDMKLIRLDRLPGVQELDSSDFARTPRFISTHFFQQYMDPSIAEL